MPEHVLMSGIEIITDGMILELSRCLPSAAPTSPRLPQR